MFKLFQAVNSKIKSTMFAFNVARFKSHFLTKQSCSNIVVPEPMTTNGNPFTFYVNFSYLIFSKSQLILKNKWIIWGNFMWYKLQKVLPVPQLYSIDNSAIDNSGLYSQIFLSLHLPDRLPELQISPMLLQLQSSIEKIIRAI